MHPKGSLIVFVLPLDQLINVIIAKNAVISPKFLVLKFCGKAQFLHSFGQLAQNYTETVPFRKISTPER